MKSEKPEIKKKGLRRYFSVSGRAPRSEMWNFPAFIATAIRRLHDLNWTGWWLLLPVFEVSILELGMKIHENSGVFYWWMWVFVPLLICCHLLVLYGMFALHIAKGTDGPNDFGEDPLRK